MDHNLLTPNASQFIYKTPVRDIRDGYQPTKQQQQQQTNNKPPHPPSGGSGVPKKN